MPAEIYFVRHGQSTWNLDGRVQGQSDEPVLTELGLRQALGAAEKLRGINAAAVVSSDLQRARQTAEVIGRELRLPVSTSRLLREHDHGSLSGLLSQEAVRVWGSHPDEPFDPDRRHGGDGESTRDVAARVSAFLASLTAVDGPIVAVTHGALIQVAVSVLTGEDLAAMPWRQIANGDVLASDGTPL